ncbi:MAG: sterol desaturase family protein [Betaproteobacteria bacterium]
MTEMMKSIVSELGLLSFIFAVGLTLENNFRRKVIEGSDLGLNLAAMIMGSLVIAFVISPLVLRITPLVTAYAPWRKLSITPDSLLWPLFLACAFVLNDFLYYWLHRALHYFDWLWSLHSFHHADVGINVTTGARVQLVEEFLRQFLVALPVGLIVDFSTIPVALAMTVGIFMYLQHMDLPLSWGRFSKVLISPHYHRIHHSVEMKHRDKNFAALMPLWDILFGTHYQPAQDEYPATGISEDYMHRSRFIDMFVPCSDARRSKREQQERTSGMAPQRN